MYYTPIWRVAVYLNHLVRPSSEFRCNYLDSQWMDLLLNLYLSSNKYSKFVKWFLIFFLELSHFVHCSQKLRFSMDILIAHCGIALYIRGLSSTSFTNFLVFLLHQSVRFCLVMFSYILICLIITCIYKPICEDSK